MPGTNREEVQLTPADTTSSSQNYFNYQPPPLPCTIPAAVAFFAAVLLIRYLAKCRSSWFTAPDQGPKRTGIAGGLLNGISQDGRLIWAMDEKHRSASVVGNMRSPRLTSTEDERGFGKGSLPRDPKGNTAGDFVPRPFISRPPPPPPLTPPELSSRDFTWDGGPRSQQSFMNQPNPDYTSATTSISQTVSPPSSQAKRRSYSRTLPLDIPAPQVSPTSDGNPGLAFSPSSYPPSSPQLPPAPPGADARRPETGHRREVDVQGEIISVLDGDGVGWSRHTRVYGGGVCLACAAAGGNHEGGFYGATVREEDKR